MRIMLCCLLLLMGTQGLSAKTGSGLKAAKCKSQFASLLLTQVWHLHIHAAETSWLTHSLEWATAGELITLAVFICRRQTHVFNFASELLASAVDTIYIKLESCVSTDAECFKPFNSFRRLDPAFKAGLAQAAKLHDLPLVY